MKKNFFTRYHLSIPLLLSVATSVVYAEPKEDLESNATIKTVNLSKVVVTATGFDQAVKDAPASISVISKEELETKPFRDITDAIREIPGITVTGSGGSTDISIRGMAPKYTLMLIDGKRQSSRETRPNSDAGGIEQGWMPPLSAIERIEVVRGPMSSLYGSDAMGGVINVITKKVSDEWGGSIRFESMLQEKSYSGNSNTIDLYANGPLIKDRLGLQLYGKYSGRDEDEYIGGFPEQKLHNFNGKLTFTPNPNHTFELEGGIGFQKRLVTAGESAEKVSEHKSKRKHQSLRYYADWENDIRSDFSMSHEETYNYSRDMKVSNINVEGSLIVPISTHTLTVGGQYKEEKLKDQGNEYNSGLSRLSRWSYALFVEDEWWITDSFALTGGLRYDYDENYGSNFNPRGYAVWNITDEFTLKGGVSTGFAAPGLRSVVADWGQVSGGGRRDGLILGNPDLRPEKSTNYELSLNYENDAGINASLTGFYTKFKDKIQTMYECNDTADLGGCIADNGKHFDFIQSRVNIDTATLKGVEVAMQIPLPKDITLKSSYTWTETEQTSGEFQGKPLNSIPKHQANVGLDWMLNDRFNLWTNVNYRGKEDNISRYGDVTTYSGYTLFDLGGSYKITNDSTIYAGIYNIGDKKIREERYGRVQDGRRYWIGVNIDF